MPWVLIADDEAWIILGLKKLLEKSGFETEVVGTADNGVAALEEIRRLQPDVIFSDIRMPGLTGLELLREIPEAAPDAKLIIISGYAEFAYAREAVQYHAFDYLLKPVKLEELQRVLESVADNLKEKSGDEAVQSPEKLIDAVLAEIREHYLEDISLTEIAGRWSISAGRLSTLIKEKLGVTYSDYITSLRIERAKELLQNETLSIQEIAEQAGYRDYFYFTKVFKKTVGISPSKYRKAT